MPSANSNLLTQLIHRLVTDIADREIDYNLLAHSITSSIKPEVLIQNVSEVLRLPADKTERLLIDAGLLSPASARKAGAADALGSHNEYADVELSPFPELFSARWYDKHHADIRLSEVVDLHAITEWLSEDPFAALYRTDVSDYLNGFLQTDAIRISEYLNKHFGQNGLRYVVTTGIGANEQFCHFPANFHNHSESNIKWFIITHTAQLANLPNDADTSNTVFLEFSRSGVTEETVKIHEFTGRRLPRIVFSNHGPLRALGRRDGNLVLSLPDQVSGRYGRNKTPILLAPMLCCKMDIRKYWGKISNAISVFSSSSGPTLPVVLGSLIRQTQLRDKRILIYLATNDVRTQSLAHELEQFWNEGVNKSGNLLLMSTFQGLPRDSHMTIEGLLGNHNSIISIFLMSHPVIPKHSLISTDIDPINPKHAHLSIDDVELVLAQANFEEFRSQMPTLLLSIHGEPSMTHSAVLGQLFADMTFVYARLAGLDPGSNPKVRNVRDRASGLLEVRL